MKLLLDTNIVIPLEPTSNDNVESGTRAAAKLVRAAGTTHAQLYLHPAQEADFANDSDSMRLALRRVLTSKYLQLQFPPSLSDELRKVIGFALPGSNDEVDDLLLAAVFGNAVHYLVSEDAGIHKKAHKLGIQDRVLIVHDAIAILEALFEKPATSFPAVTSLPLHALDLRDPIWNSFREDYPDFDKWLARARLDHRPAWIIHGPKGYAGVAIVKPEDTDRIAAGRVAKLCSLKVEDEHFGQRYGELLLKAVFSYVFGNDYDWVYVTVFERHTSLINLLSDFGFAVIEGLTDLGELRMTKPLKLGSSAQNLKGIAFNIRYGPHCVDIEQTRLIVPIQPQFHKLLFPEFEDQALLMEGEHPFGNSIRKAYLSHAPIKSVKAGDVIAFYRSGDLQAVTCIGVVERAFRSQDPEQIALAVAKRTVYTFEQIVAMCSREVLVILFRLARRLEPPERLDELIRIGALKKAPQSITSLGEPSKSWMITRLQR